MRTTVAVSAPRNVRRVLAPPSLSITYTCERQPSSFPLRQTSRFCRP
jgi:hypothetical protein